jgi:hypothetical protein
MKTIMSFISPSASLSYLPDRDIFLLTGLVFKSSSLGRDPCKVGTFAPRRLASLTLAVFAATSLVELSSLESVAGLVTGARATM